MANDSRDLARREPPEAVPSYVETPGVAGALVRSLQRGNSIVPLPEGAAQQAWQHLHDTAECARTAMFSDMLAWLRALSPATLSGPVGHNLRDGAQAVWELTSALPAGVWCAETRHRWLRGESGRYWPMPGEIARLLEPYAAMIRRDRAGCEAILALASKEPAPDRVGPPPDEVASVTAALTAHRAEQTVERERIAGGKPVVTPQHLQPDQLLRQYEQLTQNASAPAYREAARIRAAAIRRQMAREAARLDTHVAPPGWPPEARAGLPAWE